MKKDTVTLKIQSGQMMPLLTMIRKMSILSFITIVFFIIGENGHARDKLTGDPVILALGDSLTAGYGLNIRDAFPSQLQAALARRGQRVKIINAGVSGDTASGAAARLGWVLNDQVDMVIVELGGNDALRGVEPKVTYAALNKILKQLKSKNIPILFTGMQAPPNSGEAYAKEFNAVFPRLAKEYKVNFYPFFLEGVAARRRLNQVDGIHPNAIGVKQIVENILPFVEETLREVPRK